MKLKPVRDQVVVIVGANSGIGRAAALEFAHRGATVVISGRSQDELNQLVDEIHGKSGTVTAIAVQDVSDFDQVKMLAYQAATIHGRIDTWVHTPAVSIYSRFEELEPEEMRRLIDVNLLGQMYGALAALPYLRKSGGAALIHISSIEGRQSMPLHSVYAASKHGMNGFINSLRMELDHEDAPISLTNIMPASINTPFFAKSKTRLGVKPGPMPPVYPPEQVARSIVFAAEHPVKDLLVGDSAHMISFLHRLSPRLAEKVLGPLGYRLQKTDEPKPDSAPTNFFEHLDGQATVQGEFKSKTMPSVTSFMRTRPVWRYALMFMAVTAGVSIPLLVMQRKR